MLFRKEKATPEELVFGIRSANGDSKMGWWRKLVRLVRRGKNTEDTSFYDELAMDYEFGVSDFDYMDDVENTGLPFDQVVDYYDGLADVPFPGEMKYPKGYAVRGRRPSASYPEVMRMGKRELVRYQVLVLHQIARNLSQIHRDLSQYSQLAPAAPKARRQEEKDDAFNF